MSVSVAIIFGMAVLFLPNLAFACGDPIVLFWGFGLVLFALALLGVILSAGRCPVRMRIRYCGYYLLLVIAGWFVIVPLIHNSFDKFGEHAYELTADFLTPVLSAVCLRVLMNKRVQLKETP